MSRLWAERLRVGLAPDRVDLARFSLGGRRLIAETSLTSGRGSAETPWDAVVEALDAALPGFAKRADSVGVVLSNAFVRYLVLPWQTEVSSARELAELAGSRFRHTYGDAVDAWTITVSAGGYREPAVACAIDTALVDAIRAAVRRHRLRLVSLQPLLMAAYNEAKRDLGATSAFATIEAGRLCVGFIEGGSFRHIVSRRAAAPDDAIEQELATFAPAATPERVDVMLVGEDAWWPETPLRASRLLGQTARSLARVGAR